MIALTQKQKADIFDQIFKHDLTREGDLLGYEDGMDLIDLYVEDIPAELCRVRFAVAHDAEVNIWAIRACEIASDAQLAEKSLEALQSKKPTQITWVEVDLPVRPPLTVDGQITE